MKRQSGIFVLALTAAVVLGEFLTLCPAAGATDVIPMEADYPHTKPIVMFTHESHIDDYTEKYPELFADGCGACHHDDSGAACPTLAKAAPGSFSLRKALGVFTASGDLFAWGLRRRGEGHR